MKSSKLFLAPVVAGMLLVGAAGCGNQTASTPGSGDQQPNNSGWDINQQDRATLKEGGEFRGAVSDLGTQWNPNSVTGNNQELTQIRSAASSAFYTFDSGATPLINHDYLVSADAKSDPNTTVTLKMNDKAVWGDGKQITAADWIATWKALNGKDKAFKVASTEGWDSLSDVKQGATPQDVILSFNKPFPDWTSIVAGGPSRAESVADAKTFNEGWSNLKNEWFAGPFKFEGVDKAQKIVTLVPNDKWWGKKPLLTKITWRVITPEATATSFVNNEIDYFDIGSDPDAYQQAKKVSDATIRKAAGPNFRHFTFNTKAGLLSDLTIRQAIVMGLDRATIAASDLAGVDWDPKPLNNNIFVTNQTGYVDQGAATGIDYNVEAAKKKLEDAGWKAGADGIRVKDGKRLTVNFTQLVGVKASENEALQAQKMLKDIGVELKIVDGSIADFTGGKLLEVHNFGIIAFSWIGTPYPYTGIKQIYGTGSESNFTQLSVPAIDESLPKIMSEMDPAKRIELANATGKVIWENVMTLPLYQRPDLAATKTKLANFGAFGLPGLSAGVQWENVGWQK